MQRLQYEATWLSEEEWDHATRIEMETKQTELIITREEKRDEYRYRIRKESACKGDRFVSTVAVVPLM